MKKLLALAAMLLAVNVWADTPWILNDSEDQLEGKFWTICSPDGKWQLACVPAYEDIYVDYELQQEYDLIVTKWYWSSDDEEDVDLEDITGRDTALVKGSGVLTLPRRAFLGGNEYSIGYKDWSFEERETEWSRISKVVIESDFTTYVGDAFNSCGQFEVQANNPIYYSKDGVLFAREQGDDKGDLLVAMPCGKTGDYTIPAGVTKVQSGAFEYTRISSLTIGKDLVTFDDDHEVGSALKKITIVDNENFRSENGLLMSKNGNGGYDLKLTLWGAVKGKDVVVPSYVNRVSSRACAYGNYENLTGANSFIFTSANLVVEECAFAEMGSHGLDFSQVGSLTLIGDIFGDGSYDDGGTKAKTIKLPAKTTFNAGSLWIWSYRNCLTDIYWPTTESQAQSGLNTLFVGRVDDYDNYTPVAGNVKLHVLSSADWPDWMGNVPVVKDLHTVSFDPNGEGATVGEASRVVMNNQPVGTLPTPVREGYQFAGWYTEAEGGSKVISTAKVTSTVTYHAHWAAKVEPAVAEGCEGMGTVSGGGVTAIGAKATVKAAPVNGCLFQGWYDKNGEQLSTDKIYQYTCEGEGVKLYARFVKLGQAAEEYRGTIATREYEAGMQQLGDWDYGDIAVTLNANGTFTVKAEFEDETVQFTVSNDAAQEVDGVLTLNGKFKADESWWNCAFTINRKTGILECIGAEQVEEPDQPGELQMLATSIRYLPWTLDNTPNLLTGQFWTLTSPDKKWKLRCVPCTYETNVGSITVYGDTVNADVLITDEYAYFYYNGKEWQRDWAEKGTPIIQGSGTLTLPTEAVDGNGDTYTIGVGEWAFEDYSSTVRPKLVIPYDWTAPFGVGNNAFTEYEVEADNPSYYSADGVLFAKGGADGDTLMQIPASRKGTYEIPAAVARVREAAVEDVRLTELKIGPTLQEFESGHVNDYINKVTITDNDRFSCENGLLLGNNGEDLVLVLWGVVKGKDVVVPSTVTTIDASCADGLPVSSFVFTSDTLTVEDGAFEETETKVLDFSGVGHLSIGPNVECLNATTTIKFPEDTTFTAGWLQICSENNRLTDIYWETSEAQADSGLHYLQVGNGDYDFGKPGAVRLHVMNDAGEWPEVLGNVPVVKDLYVATLDFADGVQEEERIRKAGEAIGTLPTPVLDGHVFKGWFTEADGGAKVTATTKVTGTVTYYAHWAAAVTTAVMAGCDGMGSTTGGGETEIGKKAIVKATAKSGKVFAGWYMSDNTTEPAPGEYRAESYGFVSDGKPATLYARFVDKADDTLTLAGSDTTEQAVADVDGSWTLDLGAQIDSLSLPTVTVEGLPKGMTFNAETLTISGTATEPKDYTLKVTVKNKSGNTEKKTIELTVNNLRPDGFDEGWFLDEYELYGGVFDEDELAALTEGLTDLAEEGWTITASGLPAGLTYKAATATTDATFTGTATTEKEYTVYFTASRGTGNNAETRRASTTMIVEFAELTVEPNDPDCGTATGGGRYAANRKVGLRATAKTGYVFVGWFRGNEPMDAEELGADYRTASVTYVTTSDDEAITANFQPKDWIAAPVITVDGDVYELPDDGEFELDLGLAVESLTVPKITVTGLPKGLKFDAKTNLITGNATEPGNKPVTVKASNESGTTTGEFTLQVLQLKSEVGYIGNLQEGYTLEGGVPDEDTFNEYSTLASAFTQSGWSVTVTGLPKGLKYNSKTGAITGIAEAEGEYTVYIVSKQGAVTETATTVFTVVFPQLTVESADTTKGTVKDVSGGYKAGTKVTLKATPAEGCVFGGWYKVAGTEETPLEADADYRNESLTYITTTADVTIKAKFAEAADDAITINVAAEYTTGDDGTFELDLSQLVESITVPKIAVTGLPKGLKFDAKTNKISGQATTPGVDPYEVKIMATNKSETKTATFKLKVKNFRSEMFDAAWLGDEYEAIAGVMKGTTDLLGGLGSLISSGWKVSVSGLPSGIVYKAPTSTYEGEFAGTATTEGYYTLYITASKSGAATQTATTTVVVDFPMLEVTSENETRGTVTGGGKYPAGKKVTLKAKANKGYVFAGWYMAGAELEGEYRAESYTYVTGETAASIEGRFVTEEEDEEEIALVFDPAALYPAQVEIEDIQVAVDSHSIPSVKAEGLPKGLKFDAKTLKITGTPTQPGEEATVKFTVTNKSNKPGMTFWRTMKIGDAESGELPNLWYNTKPGVDGYALLVPGEEVDEDLLFMGDDLIGWTITGLPAGVKFDSKTGKFSGSATKSGEKCTLTIKKGPETATVALWTKPYPELKLGKYLMDRGDYDDDTMFKADDLFVVTGAGNYKVNTQVTVTATAPKKWVFIGWATPTEKDATTFTLMPESYDAKYTFKMPNPGDNTDTVKLVAVFTHVLGEGDVDKAEMVGFDEE